MNQIFAVFNVLCAIYCSVMYYRMKNKSWQGYWAQRTNSLEQLNRFMSQRLKLLETELERLHKKTFGDIHEIR